MPKKQEEQDYEEASQNSESTSDSHLCCCLCYCAVDYSDREAFYGYQQDDDCDNAQDKPRLLPKHLFDAQNALVLCDSCDRPYHQRCHFVPVITLPRGDWHCLLCKQHQHHEGTKPKKQSLHAVYPFPPKDENGNVLVNVTRQEEWELDSRHVKAVEWKRELARFQRALSLQLQNIRLAQDTIRSHTTSSRKSHCMVNPLKSQELCQCVVRLTTAKLRIRQWFSSLEKVRQSSDGDWTAMQDFLQHYPEETKTWFPYGKDLERRIIPRCGHSNGTDNEAESKVPTEVVVNDATKKNISTEDDDDDDMISLDDLQCCICFRGDSSDENDVLLCDGQGCFRAFHMKCVSPHVSPQEVENEDDDWFCPICTAMAKLLANVQSEYTGDEWQVEDDESTIRSWDHANDVFPEAEQEYEMAIKWKEGQHDDEMAEFMSNLLGITIENGGGSNTNNSHKEEDDDDDSEDEDFDLDAFKNRKRDDDDEESDVSSKATLQDMSDVEAKIDRKELDALSLPSEDSSDENEGGEGARRHTRSARSSYVNSANNSSDDDSSSTRPDVGTLDESNIIVGKRRRNQVDYRRLNDSMFGDISEGEAASIDDNDEFEAKIPSRRNSSSDSNSSNEDEDSSSKEKTSGSESDTNESSVGKNKRARRASKNKTTVNESDSDLSIANSSAKRRTTKNKSKQAVEKKGASKRRASKKSSAENESDSDSSKAKASRRTTQGKSKKSKKGATESSVEKKRTKQAPKNKTAVNESDSDSSVIRPTTRGKAKKGRNGATESSVEKKRVNRASKNKTTVNESDSDSSKVIRRTTRGKAKKGKNGARTAVAKSPPKSRKRNATKQDVSGESSSDESNPKGIANNSASRKPKAPTANGEKLVNGQKKRRSKRAKWES